MPLTYSDAIKNLMTAIENLAKRIRKLEIIEIPAAAGPLESATVEATSNLTLSTSWQVIPGLAVTNVPPGDFLLIGSFLFLGHNNDAGQTANGGLRINGVLQTSLAITSLLSPDHGNEVYSPVSQVWRLILSEPSTIELVALKSGGSGSSQIVQTNTTMRAVGRII